MLSASTRPRSAERGKPAKHIGPRGVHLASTRPRSVERGKKKNIKGLSADTIASTRPRSVERGKAPTCAVPACAMPSFNKATLGRAWKDNIVKRNHSGSIALQQGHAR